MIAFIVFIIFIVIKKTQHNVHLVITVIPDKAGDVNIYKCGHEILTVETVHDPSMTWNGVCKVLHRRTITETE